MFRKMFNEEYFERYKRRSWLQFVGVKEKKPFMWAYWKRQLRKFVSKEDVVLEVGCGLVIGSCHTFLASFPGTWVKTMFA